MNTAAGLGLFLLGSFSLLYATIHIPSLEFYTGGIVIALFIAGLFYAFGNAIRQGNKIAENQTEVAAKDQQTLDKETSQTAVSTQ